MIKFISDRLYKIQTEFWYNIDWIQKVFAYAIFLRKDFDFCSNSILRLLAFKISRVRKCLESDTWHKPYPKEIRRMKVCEALLKRLAAEDYMFDLPAYKNKDIDELTDEDYHDMHNYEKNQSKQDLEYFWKVFSKHYPKWWS